MMTAGTDQTVPIHFDPQRVLKRYRSTATRAWAVCSNPFRPAEGTETSFSRFARATSSSPVPIHFDPQRVLKLWFLGFGFDVNTRSNPFRPAEGTETS